MSRLTFYGILQFHDFPGTIFKSEKRSIGVCRYIDYGYPVSTKILVSTLMSPMNDWYMKRYISLRVKAKL